MAASRLVIDLRRDELEVIADGKAPLWFITREPAQKVTRGIRSDNFKEFAVTRLVVIDDLNMGVKNPMPPVGELKAMFATRPPTGKTSPGFFGGPVNAVWCVY